MGLNKNSRKRDIYTSYPNGKLDRSKNIFIFWTITPKVRPGATIHINNKPAKESKITKERKPMDWNQFVATITSAAMGFGTVYAIINRP